MNIYERLIKPRQLLWLEYGAVALTVMLPLLRPGYILTLDMVFTPKIRLPAALDNTYLFNVALHYLNYVIPSQIIEKVLLFLILVLAGVGMHRLIEGIGYGVWGNKGSGDRVKGKRVKNASAPLHPTPHTLSPTLHPKPSTLSSLLHPPPSTLSLGAYFASLFYMVNPFTYTRFMSGHYTLLLAYSLLPFFVLGLMRFINGPTRKLAVKLLVIGLLISVVSIHMIGFLVLIAFASTAAALIHNRHNGQAIKKLLLYELVILLVALAASSYWLVPYISGHSPSAQVARQIDLRQVNYFQTVPDKRAGLVPNVIGLYGFWGDNQGKYTLPKAHMPYLLPLAFVFIVLAGAGVRSGWRRDRQRTAAIAGFGLIALVLSLGIAAKPLAPLNEWLYRHLPAFKGYREPQKFVALIALAEAYFMGLGLTSLLSGFKQKISGAKDGYWQSLGVVVLLLPFLYTPTMVWGFNGQLHPVQYPGDWYALNNALKRDKQDYQVLFLPWHQYMKFNFAGRVIVNPAQSFFDKPIIQGDNAEYGNIFREISNPKNEAIENTVLRPGNSISNAGARLAIHKVKYIVLAKEVDWQTYNFLDHQPDLQRISQTANLIVYQNKAYETTPK